jgi:stage II sporulation protein D
MRTRRTVAIGTVVVAVAGLTGPAAQAGRDAVIDQEATTTTTIYGRGWGHGRGMSQYGAQGAAMAGRTAKQILDFYYPGTTTGRAIGWMRIKITADTTDGVLVGTPTNLRIRDLSAGKVWTLPRSTTMNQWSLDPYGEHGTILRSFNATKRIWTIWRTPEGRWFFNGAAQFEGPAVIPLILPSGRQVGYRGALRTIDLAGARQDTMNVVPLESYLRGVVPLEAIASWRPAALQAQAVAARTYSAYSRANAGSRGYDLCDTTACQVYGGYGAEQASTSSAVVATAGQTRLYRNVPILAEFSSSNGGVTAAGNQPYQVAKLDGWDAYSGNRNPNASWSVTRSSTALQAAFGVGAVRSMRVLSRVGIGTWGGRVLTMEVVGASGRVVLTGEQVRLRLGLKSQLILFGPTR